MKNFNVRHIYPGRPRSPAMLLVSGLLTLACSDDSDPEGGAGAASVAGSGGASGGVSGGGSAGAAGARSQGGNAGSGAAGGPPSGAGNGGSGAGTGGAGPGDAGSDPDSSGNGALAFSISSPAFDGNAGCSPQNALACDLFPLDNTGLGTARDVSPELDWVGAPANTQSFAIAFHDLSNVNGQDDPFSHWVMWNIPASETGLPAELPSGVEPGVPADETRQVSFRADNGFAGSGACGNVYEFVLYALGIPSFDPPSTASANAVQSALEASADVLDTAILRGRSDPAGPCN